MYKYTEVIYNDTYTKLLVQKISDKKEKNCIIGGFNDNKKESERVSLSRTKRNIKEICLANSFEYFVTLTINKQSCDRYVLSDCQDLLKKKLKAYKRKNADFGYIFITEKHDEGGFHFHGLVKGVDCSNFIQYTINDFDLSLGNRLPYKLINSIKRGDTVFHFDIWDSVGYNTISPIRDYNKCCNYITKYITKDCVKNEHNQIYICSRGLKKATRVEVMPFDINHYDTFILDKGISRIYENDYVVATEFDWNDLNEHQKKCYPFEIIPVREFNKNVIDF